MGVVGVYEFQCLVDFSFEDGRTYASRLVSIIGTKLAQEGKLTLSLDGVEILRRIEQLYAVGVHVQRLPLVPDFPIKGPSSFDVAIMSEVLRDKLLHQHCLVTSTFQCVCRSLVDVCFYPAPLFLNSISSVVVEMKQYTHLHHRVNIKNEGSTAKVYSKMFVVLLHAH